MAALGDEVRDANAASRAGTSAALLAYTLLETMMEPGWGVPTISTCLRDGEEGILMEISGELCEI